MFLEGQFVINSESEVLGILYLSNRDATKVKRWMSRFLYLEENMISTACLVMSGLNFIFHVDAQFSIVFRSVDRLKFASWRSFTLINKDESSANNFIVEEIF